jgi:hypothetical protein
MGIRNRGPVAPQRRGTMGSGSPISSVQQRGPEPSMMQNVSNALLNARRPRGR